MKVSKMPLAVQVGATFRPCQQLFDPIGWPASPSDPPTQVNNPCSLRHRLTPGTAGDVSCKGHYESGKAF